ncbi:MAG TPA: cation:proton antiporter [Smithellaceae bacterium]|nr:cation:proton antiporter [Smithellaceae bacterium]
MQKIGISGIFLAFFIGICLLLPVEAVAKTAAFKSEIGLVAAIGLAVISASVLSVIFHKLKQPALLAYIVSGLLIQALFADVIGSSVNVMEQVSHLGLVFLLFIIGLEMDLGGILNLGKKTAAAILLQTPLTVIIIIAVQWLSGQFGFEIPGLGSASPKWFYYAVVVALSSTAVVVKLLADKFDLGSQAGKVTILTLIGQDIWAIMALSFVSAQGELGGIKLLIMLGGAAAAAVAAFGLSRWVLVPVMSQLARSPDLIALVSIGWCFLLAQCFSQIGLSAEMGALIAGLTIGRLPIHTEILAKVTSLRDFFMALFFISLGISLPPPSLSIIVDALWIVLFVFAARLLIFTPSLLAAGQGPIVAFASSINLAQISEFSLLLLPIGLAQHVLTTRDVSVISYGMMASVLLTTYAIKYNYPLAIFCERIIGLKKHSSAQNDIGKEIRSSKHGGPANIIFAGYHHNAEALVRYITLNNPELLKEIAVIDFNLKNHTRISATGVNVIYGDISNPETLRCTGAEHAKIIISSISDTFLRNTSNKNLLDAVKIINPGALFIATADNIQDAKELEAAGAFACVSPQAEASPAYFAAIKKALQS